MQLERGTNVHGDSKKMRQPNTLNFHCIVLFIAVVTSVLAALVPRFAIAALAVAYLISFSHCSLSCYFTPVSLSLVQSLLIWRGFTKVGNREWKSMRHFNGEMRHFLRVVKHFRCATAYRTQVASLSIVTFAQP
jgi:hypothetical protein